MAMVTETAEAVSPQPARRRLRIPRPRFSSAPQEAEQREPSDIQHLMYQMLLNVDERIPKDRSKYNIGEMGLGGQRVFDTHEYDGEDIKFLDKVEEPEYGVPYIAHGTITFDEAQQAILQTRTADLNLGTIDPHIHRLVDTAMKGHKLAVPVVFDEVDGEDQVLTGDTVAYLIPNPNWITRYNLGQIGGAALVKGKVTDVDTDDKQRMKVEVAPAKSWWPAKNIRVGIGTKAPKYHQGEGVPGQRVEEGDELMIPVLMEGLKAYAVESPTLGIFSPEHMLSYEATKQTIEGTLHDMETVVQNRDVKTLVRANGTVWYISEPYAREAATRYLFEELLPLEEFMTEGQQRQMWNFIASLEVGARPIIFDANDPIRAELDQYFLNTTPEGESPRRAGAMTPQILLEEMRYMSANADNPLPLDRLVVSLDKYQTQFGSDASARLVDTVLFAREEQLRNGENPAAAIVSLLEAIPYLQEMDVDYQREFFTRFINAGVVLAQDDPNVDQYRSVLNTLLLESMSGLAEVIYPGNNYSAPRIPELLKLLPYYDEHIASWPHYLPEQPEGQRSFDYLLSHLELAKEIEESVIRRDADRAIEESEVPDDARLVSVVNRLSDL